MTDILNRHANRYAAPIVVLTSLVLLVNALIFAWVIYIANTIPEVKLTNFQPPTEVNLCPGEKLNYSFTLSVSRDALIDVSTSVQPVSSGRPSYVRLQQFSFDRATSFELVRHWVVPPTYTDPASGQEVPWQAGKYIQRTIAYVNGRSSGADELEVPFTIRDVCP